MLCGTSRNSWRNSLTFVCHCRHTTKESSLFIILISELILFSEKILKGEGYLKLWKEDVWGGPKHFSLDANKNFYMCIFFLCSKQLAFSRDSSTHRFQKKRTPMIHFELFVACTLNCCAPTNLPRRRTSKGFPFLFGSHWVCRCLLRMCKVSLGSLGYKSRNQSLITKARKFRS